MLYHNYKHICKEDRGVIYKCAVYMLVSFHALRVVYPENYKIVVERGETTTIPLKTEAPRDAEKTLEIRLTSYGGTDLATLGATVSKTEIVLSKSDLKNNEATNIGNVSEIRDAGMLLLTVPPTITPETYTFGLEAVQQADGRHADALVSGTIVIVEVRWRGIKNPLSSLFDNSRFNTLFKDQAISHPCSIRVMTGSGIQLST